MEKKKLSERWRWIQESEVVTVWTYKNGYIYTENASKNRVGDVAQLRMKNKCVQIYANPEAGNQCHNKHESEWVREREWERETGVESKQSKLFLNNTHCSMYAPECLQTCSYLFQRWWEISVYWVCIRVFILRDIFIVSSCMDRRMRRTIHGRSWSSRSLRCQKKKVESYWLCCRMGSMDKDSYTNFGTGCSTCGHQKCYRQLQQNRNS